jgi:uncharacterized damage-inducible protein DinB
MDAEIRQLLHFLDEAYDHKSWHGTNLRGSIRGLTAEEASWRPSKKRHNIWEIVMHCAYWKYAVRRRITGEKRGSFPLKGSNWFRRPVTLAGEEWKKDVELLEETHLFLRRAVESLSPSDLSKLSPKKEYSLAATIRGIASHDLYHAGQIQLLKRLMT